MKNLSSIKHLYPIIYIKPKKVYFQSINNRELHRIR